MPVYQLHANTSLRYQLCASIAWLMIPKVIQKFLQMRTEIIQVTGQTIKRLQKLRKKRLPVRIFVQCMLRRLSKMSVFFFKNEWSSNQFQCDFKLSCMQISCFSNTIVFQCEECTKMYEPKIISKESIQLFTLKSSLVDWTKNKIVAAKVKNKSPSTPLKKNEMSSARNFFKTTIKFLNSNFKMHFFEQALIQKFCRFTTVFIK